MDIAYINLARATERRAFMEAQAAGLGLSIERVEAVDARDIPTPIVERLVNSWERPLSRAELGCFLSHHALWERVAATERPILILEDDVLLSRRLPDLLPAIRALRDADLVNLEDFDRRRFVSRRLEPIAPGLSRRRTFRDKAGCAAYVLWPSGADALLTRARKGAAPGDAFLHGAVRLKAFQCEPSLAIQAQFAGARGIPAPLEMPTQIQAKREKLPLTFANMRFAARRLRTQLHLTREHLRRLGPATFARVDIDPRDFS